MAEDARWQAINEALAELPEEELRVMWLHDRHDLTLREIGAALGLEPDDVEATYARAKTRVNDRLRDAGHDELEWVPERPRSLDEPA